jgi:hypothetical protein
MVLYSRALRPATGDEQELIWTEIQDVTEGPTSRLRCCSSVIPDFENMIREVRDGAKCAVCWATFPTALEALLVDALGSGVNVTVTDTPDQDAANSAIRACVGRGGVPVVLVRKGKHWVVVGNWVDAEALPVTVFDPAEEAPKSMTVGAWDAQMMVQVDFGRYDGMYVVVEVG